MKYPNKSLASKLFLSGERKILQFLLLIYGCIGIFSLISCQNTMNKNRPIIDMHLHSYPTGYMGEAGMPNPVTGKPSSSIKEESILEATLAEMHRYNITLAVTSGPLDALNRWKSKEPERILGGVFFDELTQLPNVEELKEQFAEGRLEVLGELVAQMVGLTLSDTLFEPYLTLAEELDIPVGIHTGVGPSETPYTCCPEFRVKYGNPVLLEEVLVRYPRLQIYLMHGGWPYLEETKAIMSVYPQVYADLATIDWIIPREEFHEYLKELIRAGFGKRLMFGSDQMIWPEAIGMAVEGINSAKFLTKEEKRDIFYNNAARFLKLKETVN